MISTTTNRKMKGKEKEMNEFYPKKEMNGKDKK